jgi:adenylate kinase family enzyme
MSGNKPNRGGDAPLKRIAIIGSPGAGKSTFARQLSDITGSYDLHLNRLF